MKDRREFLKKSLLIGGVIGGSSLAGGIFFLTPAKKKFLSLIETKFQPKLFSRQEKLMGTWVAISCYATDAQKAETALAAAFTEMKLIDRLMSVHKNDSQISRLNAVSGNDAINADPRVAEILLLANKYSLRSAGKYDVTILPLMKLFGFYGKTPAKIPNDIEIAKVLKNISFKNIQVNLAADLGINETNPLATSFNFNLDSAQQREKMSYVSLTSQGSAIDLGSIGKGYAVDRATKVLQAHGITSALVNAGGNIYALGAPEMDPDPRQKWEIGIRDPKNENKILQTIALRDQAVATSGIDQTFVKIGSQEVGHIFNAVTGQTMHDFVSATAIADSATVADILSTTSYILGPKQSEELFPEAQFKFYRA